MELSNLGQNSENGLCKKAFGDDFKWGVSVSAYQIEGGHDIDGKGKSIWDIFVDSKNNIYQGQHGNIACDFYNRYGDDIALLKFLNIPNFRFSLSWPRIMPDGNGKPSEKGIAFYDNLINKCLDNGIEPWVTLYHWDLPHSLELRGGWTNRDIISWFGEYVQLCADRFGDRVKHWMVMNEPMVFTGAGYFLGKHAPGRKGLNNFLPAVHYVTLAMAEGGRILKQNLPEAEIGTTFSSSYIEPYRLVEKDIKAANRVDALLNRLFLEPILGRGYPINDLSAIKKIEKYILPQDEKSMSFDFDFIGVQNYTREIVRYSLFTPYLHAQLIEAKDRKVPITLMNWEVYPKAIFQVLKKFESYPEIKKIYVTENGAAFNDSVIDGRVNDILRVNYLKEHIKQVLRAKNDGVKVEGYFIWTFTDNFEWAEGYHPRFGLVYVNFETQERIIKDSGYWYKDFLS